MQRMGMLIGVKPEKLCEYKKLHSAVWPEVLAQISKSNIRNYSIFLREPENLLFGYLEYHGADFEKDILIKNYSTLSIEKAYKKFLIDVRNDKNGKMTFWYDIPSKSRNLFDKSNLKLERYEYPDSVWIGKDGIESRYLFQNNDGKIHRNNDGKIHYGFSLKSAPQSTNIDSIIQIEYNTPRLKRSGKYLKAIRTLKKKNSFLETFYDIKDNFGYIDPSTMAEVILKSNPDFSNPITKGLIVMEFGY